MVVATNVAETSITIDDVTCVIDCGRAKEMRFDPDRGIARLQEAWVSQVGCPLLCMFGSCTPMASGACQVA